ncbi:hypothetical protein ACWD6R_29535 [Streptomyces sp. NPDC005151]
MFSASWTPTDPARHITQVRGGCADARGGGNGAPDAPPLAAVVPGRYDAVARHSIGDPAAVVAADEMQTQAVHPARERRRGAPARGDPPHPGRIALSAV